MKGTVTPYCVGAGCGLKHTCARYKPIIDVKTEDHFPFSPNKKEYECSFFIGAKGDIFLENLKSLKNGTKDNCLGED